MPNSRKAFQIIPVDLAAPLVIGSALMLTDPGALERTAEDFLEGGRAQRIEVVMDGKIKGMYVDDLAHLKDLPRNERATKIYRAHYFVAHPFAKPESLPYIAGTAVLFDPPPSAATEDAVPLADVPAYAIAAPTAPPVPMVP